MLRLLLDQQNNQKTQSTIADAERMQRPGSRGRCIHAMAMVICRPVWSTMVADTQCSLRRWARPEYFLA